MADKASKKINPIHPNRSFGLASHRFHSFDAMVSHTLTPEEIVDPDLWVNVAPRMIPGDEIRIRADDDSFVALLHVTYSVGNKVRLKMLYSVALDEVDYEEMHKRECGFEVKQRGVKKWCIIQLSDGKVIKELIPTKRDAECELDDLLKALAA